MDYRLTRPKGTESAPNQVQRRRGALTPRASLLALPILVQLTCTLFRSLLRLQGILELLPHLLKLCTKLVLPLPLLVVFILHRPPLSLVLRTPLLGKDADTRTRCP